MATVQNPMPMFSRVVVTAPNDGQHVLRYTITHMHKAPIVINNNEGKYLNCYML